MSDDILKDLLSPIERLAVEVERLASTQEKQQEIVLRILRGEAQKIEIENRANSMAILHKEKAWAICDEIASSTQVKWGVTVGTSTVLLSIAALIASWAGLDVIALLPFLGAGL